MIAKAYITRNRPVSIVHFITNRCNARCEHCFIDFDDEEVFEGDLSLDEIKQFIGNLESTLYNVNLTGGEPFLRNDLYAIISEYFNRTQIRSITITTNGFFTDRVLTIANKFVQSQKENDRKLMFNISLDNFPEEHDKNRKLGGSFDKALDTYHQLRKLNSEKIIANISLCVTPDNCENVERLFHYLTEEKGVRSIASSVVRGKPMDKETRKNVYAGFIQLNSLIDKHLRSDKLDGYGNTFFGKAMNAKNQIMHREVAHTFLNQEFITPCYAGGLFGVVCANGDVYPCEMLSLKMGNLRDYDYDLNKIFDSRTTKKVKHFIKETKCRCTYECAWTINVLMNPKYGFEILKGITKLGEIEKPMVNGISDDHFKGDYNVSLYKVVPEKYQEELHAHPVIKIDPTDTTHSVTDKKLKIGEKPG